MITAKTGTDAARVIAIALSEVGYREQYKNGHYNNNQKYSDETPGYAWSDYQAWCGTFVAWCFYKAGLRDILKPRGGSASCAASTSAWKRSARFSEYPAVGAQIMFGSKGGTHTGIVRGYDDTYVYTVEGNTNTSGSPEGNGVYLKTYRRTNPYVYGYGYPLYKDGIISADPNWPKNTTVTQMPTIDLSNFITAHKTIEAFDRALADKGFKTGTLEDRIRAFQLAQGWVNAEADGRIGPSTAQLLGFRTVE